MQAFVRHGRQPDFAPRQRVESHYFGAWWLAIMDMMTSDASAEQNMTSDMKEMTISKSGQN